MTNGFTCQGDESNLKIQPCSVASSINQVALLLLLLFVLLLLFAVLPRARLYMFGFHLKNPVVCVTNGLLCRIPLLINFGLRQKKSWKASLLWSMVGLIFSPKRFQGKTSQISQAFFTAIHVFKKIFQALWLTHMQFFPCVCCFHKASFTPCWPPPPSPSSQWLLDH